MSQRDMGLFIFVKGVAQMHINWKIVLVALAVVIAYNLIKAKVAAASFLP